MNIAIIDAVTTNDAQMKRLKALGCVKSYAQNPQSRNEIIDRCKKADIIISGWTTFDKDILQALDKTRLIALWSTGYDQIDLKAAKSKGIKVTNVRGYAQNAVAEIAIGLMLAVYRKIILSNNAVKQANCYDWHPFLGRELTGKTIGIIGFGAIGKKVARIAKGFDMKILVHTTGEFDTELKELKYVSKKELLQLSDIVTLHLPLTSKTYTYINREDLKIMKSRAILINTARGGLVDQQALVDALSKEEIAGAGLDDILLDHTSADMLKRMEHVVLTPHIGFNTEEALIIKTDSCIDTIEAFLNNAPINLLT